MVIKTSALFILLSILVIYSEANNRYCAMRSCYNGSHTLCRFPVAGESHHCGIILRFNLSDWEKGRIVDIHNSMRYRVYSGFEHRGLPGPMPRAKYFTYLQWDKELENSAQRWADQCQLSHDICRHVRRFLVGQAVGYELTFGPVEAITVDLIVNKWYAEVVRFHKDLIFNFDRNVTESRAAENFSQMIWARTTRIGCGSLRYFNGFYSTVLLVCNYGPRGNRDGKSVYPVLRYGDPDL